MRHHQTCWSLLEDCCLTCLDNCNNIVVMLLSLRTFYFFLAYHSKRFCSINFCCLYQLLNLVKCLLHKHQIVYNIKLQTSFYFSEAYHQNSIYMRIISLNMCLAYFSRGFIEQIAVYKNFHTM